MYTLGTIKGQYHKSTEYTRGQFYTFKMLVLATVPVHETSLANQHFYSMLLGRREGVHKKSTLCTLVKMLKIMDSCTLM